MHEIKEIKRHNFELAKKRLKEFSEKKESELAIDKVKEGGFLGLGNHKVTGYELNSRLESIQGHLIDIASTNNRTIKEFREVYNALDALDKDYIASIVASVKAIEKTSNDVRIQQGTLKKHNEKLLNQQNKLDAHQVGIEKNIANIAKIVMSLKAFKVKLDSYKHLADIDKIWFDCKTVRNEIQAVSNSITGLSKKITADIAATNYQNMVLAEQLKDISNRLDNQMLIVQNIAGFVNQIRDVVHLKDVDSMWKQGNLLKADLEEANNNIVSLQQKTVETNNEIADKTAKVESSLKILDRKLKYAYLVAGGALGVAVVELILIWTGVI